MLVDKNKCTGCGICVKVCPNNAISIYRGKAEIDLSKCDDCGECIRACPRNAISSDVQTANNSSNTTYSVFKQSYETIKKQGMFKGRKNRDVRRKTQRRRGQR